MVNRLDPARHSTREGQGPIGAVSRQPGDNGAVAQPFDAEEQIDRIVGRRSLTSNGLSTATSYKAESIARRRSFGGVRVPRGVHRFTSHDEADQWLWRMIARPTT